MVSNNADNKLFHDPILAEEDLKIETLETHGDLLETNPNVVFKTVQDPTVNDEHQEILLATVFKQTETFSEVRKFDNT